MVLFEPILTEDFIDQPVDLTRLNAHGGACDGEKVLFRLRDLAVRCHDPQHVAKHRQSLARIERQSEFRIAALGFLQGGLEVVLRRHLEAREGEGGGGRGEPLGCTP